MEKMSATDIARLAGVTPQAVSKSKLPRDEDGMFDPEQPRVADYIKGSQVKYRRQRQSAERRREKEPNSGISSEILHEIKLNIVLSLYEAGPLDAEKAAGIVMDYLNPYCGTEEDEEDLDVALDDAEEVDE